MVKLTCFNDENIYFNTNHIVAVGKFNKNPQHSIVYTTEKENEYLVKESLEEVVQRIEEEATKPRHFGQSCIEIIENAANSDMFKSMSPETEIHTKSLTVDGIQVFLNWFVNTEKDTT